MTLETLLNREAETGQLEQAWKQASAGEPQLVVVWGRRRVGKTFLLSHFVRGKRAVFFGATEQSEAVELSRLAEAVGRDLDATALDAAGGGLATWEAALRFFAAQAADEPLAVVLDEVPYLERSTPGFASVVQVVWDHLRAGTKLMLVVTGSAIGTIESMLGPSGALRGRPTTTLKIDPVDPPAARTFLPRLEAVPLLEAYSACGGYPLHLRQWDEDISTEANLIHLAGTAGGLLLEDATRILWEELPEAAGYPRILGAIGRGRTRFSQIASEAGQRIEYPLEILQRVGLVRKVRSVGAPRGARATYEIGDPYLAFWFGVLYSDRPEVEAGQGKSVLRRRRPQWERHLGWVFEEAARAHARRLVERGELPDDLVVGRWWTSRGEPCEVDVLGLRGSRTHLLGEARWQERLLGGRDLEALRRKAARVPQPADQPTYALWGRSGVEAGVTRAGALGFDAEQVLSR